MEYQVILLQEQLLGVVSSVVWCYEFIFRINLCFLGKYLYQVSKADIIHIFIKWETYEKISHSKILKLFCLRL